MEFEREVFEQLSSAKERRESITVKRSPNLQSARPRTLRGRINLLRKDIIVVGQGSARPTEILELSIGGVRVI